MRWELKWFTIKTTTTATTHTHKKKTKYRRDSNAENEG